LTLKLEGKRHRTFFGEKSKLNYSAHLH